MAPGPDNYLYGGGDGSSLDQAVVINTLSSAVGIPADYGYLARVYGQQNVAWSVVRQVLLLHGNVRYDRLHIRLSNGEERSIYFDISQFYGQE